MRPRNAERTRQAVLDAAERILARDGWAGATLAVVGAEAGVSRGTPAYFFRSKAGLFEAMAARLVDAARAAAGVEASGDPPRRVAALLRRQLELVASRPGLSRLAVLHWAARGAGAGDGARFAAFERDFVRLLADLIERVPARPATPDAAGMAAELVVLVWSAGLPNSPGGSVAASEARLADRVALVQSMVLMLLGDKRLAQPSARDGGDSDNSLSASKSQLWRLPGVG